MVDQGSLDANVEYSNRKKLCSSKHLGYRLWRLNFEHALQLEQKQQDY